mgnify:CR=1 FL=1
MFIRAPNSGRKLLLTCIVAGVMIAILVSCLQFLVAWHKHEVKYDTLITDVQKYLDTYFADLKSTTDRLQPLTLDTCQQANPEMGGQPHQRAVHQREEAHRQHERHSPGKVLQQTGEDPAAKEGFLRQRGGQRQRTEGQQSLRDASRHDDGALRDMSG